MVGLCAALPLSGVAVLAAAPDLGLRTGRGGCGHRRALAAWPGRGVVGSAAGVGGQPGRAACLQHQHGGHRTHRRAAQRRAVRRVRWRPGRRSRRVGGRASRMAASAPRAAPRRVGRPRVARPRVAQPRVTQPRVALPGPGRHFWPPIRERRRAIGTVPPRPTRRHRRWPGRQYPRLHRDHEAADQRRGWLPLGRGHHRRRERSPVPAGQRRAGDGDRRVQRHRPGPQPGRVQEWSPHTRCTTSSARMATPSAVAPGTRRRSPPGCKRTSPSRPWVASPSTTWPPPASS